MASSDVSTLLAQLDSISQNAPTDELSRKKLYDAARSLAIKLETPGDTVQRIAYSPAEITAVRIGSNLGLFKLLAKKDGSPMNVKEIAEATKADDVLIGRILRYLASVQIIKETGVDMYAASHISNTLATQGLIDGVNHNFDLIMPCWQQLPKLLADTDYQNPTDPAKCGWQLGHQTDELPFVWILSRPDKFTQFNLWMTAQREGQNTWLDVFPFEQQLCHGLTPEKALFVDVGGGIGHQCLALKTKFPTVQGRIILQDRAEALQMALPMEDVEKIAYDFWTPQPITGAKAYYMRNIMHDYPDEKAIKILHNTMAAMDKDSVILIDEMILPNEKAPWRATQLDILVMASLAAVERSEKQWYALLDAAGLKIVKIWTYTEELRDSIIVAVPK